MGARALELLLHVLLINHQRLDIGAFSNSDRLVFHKKDGQWEVNNCFMSFHLGILTAHAAVLRSRCTAFRSNVHDT